MNNIKYLNVSVAKTPHQIQSGLMFRERLPSDAGMLFSFPNNNILSFWGMNTFIPLDIAFVNKSNTIDSIERIKPHDLTSVKSKKACCHAIEANEGWFHKNGISEGDFIEIFNDGLGNVPKVFFINNQLSIKKAQVENQEEEVALAPEEDLDLISRDNFFDNSNVEDSEYLVDNEDFASEPEGDVGIDTEDIAEDVQDGAREFLDIEDIKPPEIEIEIPQFSNAFQAINWGKINNQTIVIKYKTLKGNIIVREVEPHDVFFARTTRRQIMATFDKQVGAPRSFIVMNILEYSFNGVPFVQKFIVV